MSNWLEKAENEAAFGNDTSNFGEKLRLKKEAIQKNYLDNQFYYDNFIVELEKLVNRVNDLPLEYRQPFGKINFHSKDSKLNNHLYYISSSSRIKKRMYKSVFHFFKQYTFKKIRVAYFTVSAQPGLIDIELKQNMLLKVRMTRAGDNESLKDPRRNNKDRKDYRFKFDIKQIDGEQARDIIDWLAFKKEMEEIVFFREQPQLPSS